LDRGLSDLSRKRGQTEDDLITAVDAEGDDIAIAQHVLLHLDAVHKQAVAVAAVFKPIAGIVADNRGASSRDAPIGKLQVVFVLAAANQKRGLGDGNALAGTVG